MAPRVGFSLGTLRKIDPAACSTDARFVWKESDNMNLGIVLGGVGEGVAVSIVLGGVGEGVAVRFIQGLHVASTRELRLLGAQMIRHADMLDHEADVVEVVVP